MSDDVSEPWRRSPRVEIPPEVDRSMLRVLDDVELAELVRTQLLPPDDDDQRRRWKRMWQEFGQDDPLGDRVLDVLDEFQGAARNALAQRDVDDPSHRRIRKFLRSCEGASSRIINDTSSGPLSWSGRAGRGIRGEGAVVINKLVDAIVEHRGQADGVGSASDRRLWSVLARTGFDPDRIPDD